MKLETAIKELSTEAIEALAMAIESPTMDKAADKVIGALLREVEGRHGTGGAMHLFYKLDGKPDYTEGTAELLGTD